VGPIERVARWCRRNPRISLVTGSAALVVAATICLAFVLINASRIRAFDLANEKSDLAQAKGRLLEEKTGLLEEKARLVDQERQARRATEKALAQAKQQKELAESRKGEAEQAADQAKAVNDFLIVDMIGAASPEWSRGKDIPVREMLDRAARLVGERFAEHPEREAAVRDAIARAYHGLGLHEQSHQHWTIAFELRRRVLGAEHLDTLKTMNNLASNHYSRGEFAAGQKLEEASLDILTRRYGPEHATTLTTIGNLAANLHAQGQYAKAQQLFEKVLKLKIQVHGTEDVSTLTTMGNLAVTLHVQRKYDEAMNLTRLRRGLFLASALAA
jgi:tetratricopeptide (TPR) repeat protein